MGWPYFIWATPHLWRLELTLGRALDRVRGFFHSVGGGAFRSLPAVRQR